MCQPSWNSGTSGFYSVSKFSPDPGVEEAFLGLPALETKVLSLLVVVSTTCNFPI